MAKQKVVIKVTMKDQKSRSCAMKIAVGFSGVESAAIEGDSKDQIAVTGEQMDSAKLTRRLRKKFGCANLVSVGDVEKKEEKKEKPTVVWPYSVPHCNCYVYEMRDSYQCYQEPYNCSIM